MRIPQPCPPIERSRYRRSAAAKSSGVLPQPCTGASSLCSCAFSNACCAPGSTCSCPFGFASC
jgi:hypothetical protein